MDLRSSLLVSRSHFDGVLSLLLVGGVATAGLLVVAAVALWLSRRQRRAAAQAEASFDTGVALATGPAVVMGTVEREPGASVAVRVEVEQDGSEAENSGIWTHRWTETDRRVLVHPFRLHHASGARVRVEPAEDVMLVDPLDGAIRVDLTKRVRVAEILPDQRLFAVGELRRAPDPEAPTRGYRERAEGFVLVRPRGGRMLLSSEALGERFARRAAFHRRWAILAVFAALAYNGLSASFHARSWLGETVSARITRLRTYEDSDDVDRFEVTMQGPDGFIFSDEVSRAAFSQLHEGDRIKARYVPSWPSASVIGPDATAHTRALLAVPLLAVIALAYRVNARSTRPWYEQKKLVDKGSGRLAEREPTREATRRRR